MHPVPRIFFQKNQKKWIFFKNTTTNHICSKNEFFEQNTTTDWIFLSWKFWDPMLWPIKFFKKSQKWPIFCSFSSKKPKWKKWICEIEIYNSPHELWKKSRFCQVFSRKNWFFLDFLSIFSFFFQQSIFSRARGRFQFHIFTNFHQFLKKKKIEFSFFVKKNFFQFHQKKLFVSISLSQRNNYQFKKKLCRKISTD